MGKKNSFTLNSHQLTHENPTSKFKQHTTEQQKSTGQQKTEIDDLSTKEDGTTKPEVLSLRQVVSFHRSTIIIERSNSEYVLATSNSFNILFLVIHSR